jgi:hypothetical protein
MNTAELVILGMMIPNIAFVGIREEGLLPPIPVSEPIPPSEEIPAGTLTTIYGTESMPSWEFQRGNFYKFWMILAFLLPLPISILFCLMEYRFRQSYYRELSQIRTLVATVESFMLEWGDAGPFMKEVEEKLRAEFQNHLDPMKKIMEEEDGRRAEFQNELDKMKKIIKVEYEFQTEFREKMDSIKMFDYESRPEFQNVMDSLQMMSEEAGERLAKFQIGIDIMKKIIRADYELRTEFQKEMDSIKEMMKEYHYRRAQLQNEMGSMKKLMKEYYKGRAQFQNEMVSMKLGDDHAAPS